MATRGNSLLDCADGARREEGRGSLPGRHGGKVGIKEEGGFCEPGLGEGRMAWVSIEPEDFWCVCGVRGGRSRT